MDKVFKTKTFWNIVMDFEIKELSIKPLSINYKVA